MTKIGAMTNDNLHESMRWEPERGTNLTVLDLTTGKSIIYKCNETFFAFHITNSFINTQGDIVIDIVTYDDDTLFLQMFLNAWRNGSAVDHTNLVGTLKRIVIPYTSSNEQKNMTKVWYSKSFTGAKPTKNNVARATYLSSELALVTTITDVLIEGPRINDKYLNNPDLKYVYGWTATREKNIPNAIVKVDVSNTDATINSIMWKNQNVFNVYIGEPVFIAAPDAVAEDDGVVIAAGVEYMKMNVSANGSENMKMNGGMDDMFVNSFLLVLNATNLVELGRATRENVSLPFAFHTQFYKTSL